VHVLGSGTFFLTSLLLLLLLLFLLLKFGWNDPDISSDPPCFCIGLFNS
jgi:hypothetical protein